MSAERNQTHSVIITPTLCLQHANINSCQEMVKREERERSGEKEEMEKKTTKREGEEQRGGRGDNTHLK